MAEPSIDVLGRVPIFSDLNKRELERIARSFRERRFSAGDTVVEEGKGGVGFFVVADGSATVTVHGEPRGALGPGDYFGEIALIDDGARSATVTAESDLRCFGLAPWEFRPLVETNAGIAWKLVQAMAKRLRDAEQYDA